MSGKVLKRLREERGKSTAEMAADFQVAQKEYEAWEDREALPARAVVRVIKVFGMETATAALQKDVEMLLSSMFPKR